MELVINHLFWFFCFSSLGMGKLTHFSLPMMWCQLWVDCQNKTCSSYVVYQRPCLKHSHFQCLLFPCNWLSFSARTLCWISSSYYITDDSRCGSENVAERIISPATLKNNPLSHSKHVMRGCKYCWLLSFCFSLEKVISVISHRARLIVWLLPVFS